MSARLLCFAILLQAIALGQIAVDRLVPGVRPFWAIFKKGVPAPLWRGLRRALNMGQARMMRGQAS